jgi:hypothetical protein
VLKFPDFSKTFILTTDASLTALGGILSQEFEDNEHPIACASRQLEKAETSYSATELECLAVEEMVKNFESTFSDNNSYYSPIISR